MKGVVPAFWADELGDGTTRGGGREGEAGARMDKGPGVGVGAGGVDVEAVVAHCEDGRNDVSAAHPRRGVKCSKSFVLQNKAEVLFLIF